MKKPTKAVIWIAVLSALAGLPHVLGILHTNVFIGFVIMATFAVSLNMMFGFTGLLSFGHAMFFGAGAYATALGLLYIPDLPLSASVGLGGLSALALALLISPLLVRVSGTAFSMLTLAFGQLMYIICLKYREVTGGEDGLGGFEVPKLEIPFSGPVDLSEPIYFYYFAMIVLGSSIWIMWYLTRTTLGSVMISIRDNSSRVDYLGFHVPVTKAIVFLISGGFAGIAGSVYALFQTMVSTDGLLVIYASFNPIIMTIVGGASSFFGPVIGAALLTVLEEIVVHFTDRIDMVNGIILILVIMYAPSGLAGLWSDIRTKWYQFRNSK